MGASSVVASLMMISIFMLNGQLQADAALSAETHKSIDEANQSGPYLGLVIPNTFEMNPLLQSPNFTSTNFTIDVSGTHANRVLLLHLEKKTGI